MRVFLVGFMGAGKTSVGRILASRLAYRFVDLDDHIETTAGLDIPEIFARHGEARFRDIEHDALTALVSEEQIVVATGGGTAVVERNRALMTAPEAVVIWLDPDWPTLVRRLGTATDPTRPLYASGDQAKRLWHDRRDAYRRAGQRVRIAPDETADEVADRVIRRLREQRCAT